MSERLFVPKVNEDHGLLAVTSSCSPSFRDADRLVVCPVGRSQDPDIEWDSQAQTHENTTTHAARKKNARLSFDLQVRVCVYGLRERTG